MTRGEIIEAVTKRIMEHAAGVGRVPRWFLRGVLSTAVTLTFRVIEEALVTGEAVTILNFGRFDVQVHKARMGNTIRGGVATPVEIPERRTVRFRPSARLKTRMEGSMEKYGVQTDQTKTKTAEKGGQDKCNCGETLEKQANVPKCPVHGTEPFEKKKSEGK